MVGELKEEILWRHRAFLEERIDPDSGLRDVLLSSKILSRGEISEIRANPSYHMRNTAILDLITDKKRFNRLVKALKETDQLHLVNYLNADGQYRPNLKDVWPLTDKEMAILNANKAALVDLIDPDELVRRLYSRGVINRRQRDTISSEKTCHERNEVFLEILSRRSVRDFRNTIRCLIESNQRHIAEILDEGGVVVNVHTKGIDDKTGDEIIADFQKILSKSSEEAINIRENIHQWLKNWLDERRKKMSDLPFELLDSILLKSSLESVLRENQVLKHDGYDTFSQMASVDYCWFQRIKRRKFKKEVRKRLLAYYEDTDKGLTIIRNNRNFLVNTIRPDKEFLNKLQSNSFLTDKKRHCLDQLQRDKEKNLELLLSLNFHNTDVYSCFIRCLKETNQHLAAKVLDNGGVVAEVKICEKINSQILEKLVQQLNGIKQNLFIENSKFDHSMRETAGLEILHSRKDRKSVTIFLWCKTKEALDWLKIATESELLQEILTQLFSRLSCPVTIRDIIVDQKLFKKEVVFFSIIADFTSRFDLRRRTKREMKEFVSGVTKLRNKVYVLLRYEILRHSVPRCVIRVFEDQIPFHFRKRIKSKEIKDPYDIASIEVENSLYVFDSNWVWKIKVDEKEETEKIGTWLKLKSYSDGIKVLSMTKEGQLLMLSRRSHDPFLSMQIFGEGKSEGAELRLSIPFPEDIQGPYWETPNHAVKTSKGNFIISHRNWKEEKKSGSAGGGAYTEKRFMAISEVSGNGKTILRCFIPKNEEQKLSFLSSFDFILSGHLAVDSFDRAFLADSGNHRVILFDSELQWNGILIPTEKDGKEGRRIRRPERLFYDEIKKELFVVGEEVFVYTLNRK